VRRAVLRLTSQGYNRILASILAAAIAKPEHADQAVIDVLRAARGRSALWPTDDDLRLRLESSVVYGYVGAPRLRMLLEACELELRDSAHVEDLPLPEGLSVEHVLPQAWVENWPLPDGLPQGTDADAAAALRESRIHRLGNLTLVTQPLNARLSNAAWIGRDGQPSKRHELDRHSLLLLNRELQVHDQWDEDTIDVRGTLLTERILCTWPGPNDTVWQLATTSR